MAGKVCFHIAYSFQAPTPMITVDQPKRSLIQCPKANTAFNNLRNIQIVVIPFSYVIDS
jgi:hypothetical protein